MLGKQLAVLRTSKKHRLPAPLAAAAVLMLAAFQYTAHKPSVTAADASAPATAPQIFVDFVDPAYGTKVRQLKKDDGHEHNLYYFREMWNADGSRMLGIQTDLDQKNWRVCLYDGDGAFLAELFPISKYNWKLCWDRNDPKFLYTNQGSNLYRFDVTSGQATLLKSFAPDLTHHTGPSLNQAGDRILIITTDARHKQTLRSYRLPDMTEERFFQITPPPGCFVNWDKPHYTGYRNYIDTTFASSDPKQPKGGIAVYDDTGELVHTFEGLGTGGHYDWSPDGKLAYFKLPRGGRGAAESPFEIHVVNLDGSGDRVLFSLPRAKCRFQNVHLSWPRRVSDWFVAGFFPSGPGSPRKDVPAQASRGGRTETRQAPAGNAPSRGTQAGAGAETAAAAYEPPLDEILMLRLDGTTTYLARTQTVYSAPSGRRGGLADNMFWAQPLPRPSPDGRRIGFNSNRSGTIDLHILYTEGGPPDKKMP